MQNIAQYFSEEDNFTRQSVYITATERKTDKETSIKTDTQTSRQRNTQRKTNRHTKKDGDKQTDTQNLETSGRQKVSLTDENDNLQKKLLIKITQKLTQIVFSI